MFAALRGDFSERKRERCVRLDAGPGGRLAGAEEWARLLGAALRETFEARARAYDAEARSARGPSLLHNYRIVQPPHNTFCCLVSAGSKQPALA